MTRGKHFKKPARRTLLWRRGAVLLAFVVLAGGVAFVALRDGDDDREVAAADTTGGQTTDTTLPLPTTTTVPTGYSFIAAAIVDEVAVFDAPEAPAPAQTFPNPWFLNDNPEATVPLVFHVEEERPDGWLRVLLPVRPNGSTGWIRKDDVDTELSPYHVKVELGAHKLTAYEGTDVILDDTVAIGTPENPTPTGRFYLRVLIETLNPGSPYGPFAYGLSGYSPTLTEFNGGDGEVGIHGNNDSSVLGKDVSHGCVRMDNDKITELTDILPLGTLVEIVA